MNLYKSQKKRFAPLSPCPESPYKGGPKPGGLEMENLVDYATMLIPAICLIAHGLDLIDFTDLFS